MENISKFRVLIAGILCPFATIAIVMGIGFYAEHWNVISSLPGISIPVAMFLATLSPFAITLTLAANDYRRHVLTLSGKIGVAIAAIALIAPAWAAYGALYVWRSERSLSLRNVPAPVFSTLDLDGKTQSPSDQKGKVVLVNVWATWCTDCRAEMPELDQLYREHKNEGLIIYGLSDEDVATQKKCQEKIPVTYPLLTYNGQIPALYRQVATYPTTFLIDRQGNLQGGISGERRVGELEAAAVSLLSSNREGGGSRGTNR